MAGRNGGFNAKQFRTAIRSVYNMAAPPLADEQATFYFPALLVYNRGVDADDVPFDPAATVTRTQLPPVKVPCAIEFDDTAVQITDFGQITPGRVKITFLDEDYEKIKGCAYVVIRGEKYNYQSTQPPSGLFDVGLYTLKFTAESST